MSTNTVSRRRLGAPNDHDRTRVINAARKLAEAETTYKTDTAAAEAAYKAAIEAARNKRDAAIERRAEAVREAHEHGVDTKYLVELLKEGGTPLSRWRVIAMHGGDRPITLDTDEAVRRYTAGESARAIAQDYRVGVNTLKKALTDAGVELRDRETAKQLARKQATT